MLHSEKKSIQVISNIDSIRTVTDFVNKHLALANCPTKARKEIDIVIDEILSNIVYYAYEKKEGPVKVSVELSQDQKDFKLIFEDQGIPYNPLEREDPNISLDLEDREVGGLGVFLIKKMMDDVSYSYQENTNRLTVTKRIHE